MQTDEFERMDRDHNDAVVALRELLGTGYGKVVVKYLFRYLDVGEMPAPHLSEDFLMRELGRLDAGNSIFKMVAEANFETAGLILAEVQKERYYELVRKAQSEND